MTTTTTEINLAVYMERLDGYIESQTILNNTVVERLEQINAEISELNTWRNRVYGAKTIIIALGLLILHTSAVMGSFAALINFMNK
tara:strand:- start:2869 stop:3126 length:258 start_codon:yes stop_codon:yes gene_type:complete